MHETTKVTVAETSVEAKPPMQGGRLAPAKGLLAGILIATLFWVVIAIGIVTFLRL